MTSTSFIIGTGLKKCIPITLSGRLVSAASLVIEMDEVFDDRITSGPAHRVQVAKELRLDLEALARRLDDEVAIGQRCGRSTVAVMRASAASRGSAVIFALATSRSRFLRMVSTPRSRKRCSTSTSTTVVAALREDMGDAVAHGARTNHSYSFNFHESLGCGPAAQQNTRVYQRGSVAGSVRAGQKRFAVFLPNAYEDAGGVVFAAGVDRQVNQAVARRL